MASTVVIDEVVEMSREIHETFLILLPQLSSSSSVPTYEQLAEIVASPATHLLIARDRGSQHIVGCLTLVLFRIPTGLRAWIEDVVVDSKERGKGIGKELCRAAIEMAGNSGARTIDLTSRPSREAANKLYKSIGFSVRDTNVYRFTMEETINS
jgi:ribosomal protein S18 acetylase RimI-like enzyme